MRESSFIIFYHSHVNMTVKDVVCALQERFSFHATSNLLIIMDNF